MVTQRHTHKEKKLGWQTAASEICISTKTEINTENAWIVIKECNALHELFTHCTNTFKKELKHKKLALCLAQSEIHLEWQTLVTEMTSRKR